MYLHLHDTPQVPKLRRDESNKLILAQVTREKCSKYQHKFYAGHQYQHMMLEINLNHNEKTYSLNRCSKLPMADGIGPVITLQDKSLTHVSSL
jgi:hypothetical protein